MKNRILFAFIAVLFLAVSCDNDMPAYELQEEGGEGGYIENLLITTDSVWLRPFASSQEVVIITRAEEIQVSANQAWCTPSVNQTAEGKTISVSVTENPNPEIRTATVTVTAYGISKTFVAQQSEGMPAIEAAWYTVETLAGAWNYNTEKDKRFFRYHRKIDNVTFLTTLNNVTSAALEPVWDETIPGNYPLYIELKAWSETPNVIDCDVSWGNTPWPYVYGSGIYDNTSTYNTETQELHLNFKIDWGNDYTEIVNERVYYKRAEREEAPLPADLVEGAWYTVETLAGAWNYPTADFSRYTRKIDDRTLLTTLNDISSAALEPVWDETIPGNYPLYIKLFWSGIPNVVDCRVSWGNTQWPYVYGSGIYDNTSTYNTETQEFHLNFKIDWGNDYTEVVNERVYNKRSEK